MSETRVRAVTFGAPLVNALLTGGVNHFMFAIRPRRLVGTYGVNVVVPASEEARETPEQRLPYRAGDILWVRETWTVSPAYDGCGLWMVPDDECLYFRADDPVRCHRSGCQSRKGPGAWRSPVQMPKWASRLTLEVLGVHIERFPRPHDEAARTLVYWNNLSRDERRLWEEDPLVCVVSVDVHQCNVRDFLAASATAA